MQADHARNGGDMTDTDIKTTARRVLEEVFPADDEAALAEVISEDFVNHEAPAGRPPRLASITYYMHLLAAAFSDQRWTIHRVLAEGDTAVIYCTHSGRHTGDFFGLPATGCSFAYKQMHLIRFAAGKGAEHWAVRDEARTATDCRLRLVGDRSPACGSCTRSRCRLRSSGLAPSSMTRPALCSALGLRAGRRQRPGSEPPAFTRTPAARSPSHARGSRER
jgi:predicted ester cyclase